MTFTPRSLEDLALDFPPEIKHLSATGINTAMRCLEQWRQIYIKGLRIPPDLARIGGRADHAAIEFSMKQKVETYIDLPVAEVRESFLQAVEQGVEDEGGLSELTDGTTSEYDTLRRRGQDLVERYHRQVSPTVQPIAVEEYFSVEVKSLPVVLEGRIDLETETHVIDRKRTTRKPSKPKPEWVMQGRIYQLIKPKPFDWHLSITTKTTQQVWLGLNQPVPSQSGTELALEKAALMIGSCYQQFGPDETWPMTGATSDWACNYCGFRPECPYWKEES